MAHIPYWGADPDAWGRLVLGPHVMPGVWTVEFDRKFNVSVKKGKGYDGAHVVDLGLTPAENVTLTGRIITSADWAELQVIIPQLAAERVKDGQGRGERVTYEILHPIAALIGLNKIYIDTIAAPTHDGYGILTQVIRGVESRDPKPTKAKPKVVKQETDAERLARGDEEFIQENKQPQAPNYTPPDGDYTPGPA